MQSTISGYVSQLRHWVGNMVSKKKAHKIKLHRLFLSPVMAYRPIYMWRMEALRLRDMVAVLWYQYPGLWEKRG
jgi:hypothetical protein